MNLLIAPTIQQLNGRNLRQYEYDSMKRIIETYSVTFTEEKCANWFNNIMSILPKWVAKDT